MHTHMLIHTHTHTRSRPALPSPLPPALASTPRLLRRARVRARFVAVFYRCCCCCCCCCNRIGSCTIPGIEFREWYKHTSGPDSSLAASSGFLALASCAIAHPSLLLLLLLQHSCNEYCPWGYIPRMAPVRLPPPVLPSRAPTVVAAAVYPPAPLLESNSGDMRVCLLDRDR